jgi:hypothetical protein
VDVELSPPVRGARAAPVARLAAVPAHAVLAAMVAVGAAARWLGARGHDTPTYFPDEWAYPALARGIATTGRPTVHGEPASFPALLEPLLTAPVWLADPVVALRAVQAVHALEVSLAAVPAYLLARRLGAGSGLSLAAAAAALAAPGLAFASYATADALGYLLALTAVYAGVRALDRPTAGSQLAFLALAGLATLARVQYAFLPLAFLGAALVLEGGRPLRAAARFRVAAAATAVPLALAAAAGPQRLLGAYWSFPHDWYSPAPLARWLASDAYLLSYAAGWALVPAALVAVVVMAVRPRGRAERAFAVLFALCASALLIEAAVIASIDSQRFQERYLLLLPPLVAVAFAAWAARGAGRRYAVAALALALLVASSRVPLSGFATAHGADDSPTLWSLVALGTSLGKAGASLVFAGGAALLSLLAIAAAFRPRVGGPAALAVTAAVAVGMSAAAHVQDARNAAFVRSALLPADARWVDRSGLEGVTLVQTPLGRREGPLSHLFWNRSITRVVRLEGAGRVDAFAAPEAAIAGDGRLLAEGRPLSGPLLVHRSATQLELAGAELVASEASFDLWNPGGGARVSTLATGLHADHWLGPSGAFAAYPDESGRARGTLLLTLSLPAGHAPNAVRLSAPGVSRTVQVRPGRPAAVELRFDRAGPWTLRFEAARVRYDGLLRPLSVQADARFTREG